MSLLRNDREILLEAADDGRGLKQGRREEALRTGHIGLASCAERIEAIGGTLEITSNHGQGTLVRAALPARVPGHLPSDASASAIVTGSSGS